MQGFELALFCLPVYLGMAGWLHHITALCLPRFVLSSETRHNSSLSTDFALPSLMCFVGGGGMSPPAIRSCMWRIKLKLYAGRVLTECVQVGGGGGVLMAHLKRTPEILS